MNDSRSSWHLFERELCEVRMRMIVHAHNMNGRMAERQNGRMAGWQNGRMAEWNGPSRPLYFFPLRFHPAFLPLHFHPAFLPLHFHPAFLPLHFHPAFLPLHFHPAFLPLRFHPAFLPSINVQTSFFSFPDLGDPASKQDRRLIGTSVYNSIPTARISRKCLAKLTTSSFFQLLSHLCSLETSKND